jgi:hypothetical protein
MRELDRNIYQRKLVVKTNSEMEKEIYIYAEPYHHSSSKDHH